MFDQGKVLQGYSVCQNMRAGDGSGATVSCERSISPVSPPTLNPYSGQWETYVSVAPSTGLCGAGKSPDGTVYDGAGDATPVPPAPVPSSDPPPPPKTCGGGSCYDPASDQYCAVVGGSQVCVPGSSGRSPGGACASNDGGTVCSGSPSSPPPPAPPKSPISDPASETNNIDHTTQADPVTGANSTVTTTTYSTPGTATQSGAKTGDYQPAGSSSTGSPAGSTTGKGSASGGADCSAPPVCTGDPVNCMTASQVWSDRCKPHLGEDDTGRPNWTKVADSDGDQYATTPTDVGQVIKTNGDGTGASAADGGTGQLDQSGFAGNTCPLLPSFEVFGQVVSFDQDLFCSWLATIRGIMILVAAFVSARILASGGKA